jgi:hypothetical protein
MGEDKVNSAGHVSQPTPALPANRPTRYVDGLTHTIVVSSLTAALLLPVALFCLAAGASDLAAAAFGSAVGLVTVLNSTLALVACAVAVGTRMSNRTMEHASASGGPPDPDRLAAASLVLVVPAFVLIAATLVVGPHPWRGLAWYNALALRGLFFSGVAALALSVVCVWSAERGSGNVRRMRPGTVPLCLSCVWAVLLVLSGRYGQALRDELAYRELQNRPRTAAQRETVAKSIPNLDANDTGRTSVLATLDSPMPEGKNAIWCATFQMAWDKFKQDVIREPLQVSGTQDLADRLNSGTYPTTGIEKESFYVAAGRAGQMIQQIQKDMAQQFPTEPVPVFDKRYRTLPEGIMAYAFLQIGIEFEYPFYVNERPFAFTEPAGPPVNVASFCAHTREPDADLRHLHEQVEILYYRYGEKPEDQEFAVDLCKSSRPYQIIIARMAPRATLGDTASALRQSISDFSHDSDYSVLSRLRPIDRLIVPDVLYRLTHHFTELEDKWLGNHGWEGFFIFEASQMIDFSLSRTGVLLKSEARFATGRSKGFDIDKPRYLYFDRAFLVCVKKRTPEAAPFFVMWVANADLMSKTRD